MVKNEIAIRSILRSIEDRAAELFVYVQKEQIPLDFCKQGRDLWYERARNEEGEYAVSCFIQAKAWDAVINYSKTGEKHLISMKAIDKNV